MLKFKTVFNIALWVISPPPPPPTTPTFDVALEVCVCVCDYFIHFVSCSVFLIDLVTSVLWPVLSCQSCLQNVKQKPKNLSLLLFLFLPPPHPPCNYYDFYYYMQRLKESCNFLASVPALPWAQKVEEKEGEKTRNKFFRSKYNSKFSI